MSPASTLPQSLAHRLAEGKLPVAESLRTGTQLAEALRKLHDTGRVHGAVSPASVTLTTDGVELTPALASLTPTPYTAPEVIAGKSADAASDIFSYGAVLYEMLTGRRAFDGSDSASIAAAVTGAQPAPTGSPAVDRLMAACLAKDPAARPPRMQKVILELKMLSMVARRAEQPPQRRDAALETALRSEIAQLEARIDRRLESHRQEVAESHRGAAETLSGLRGELGGIASQLDAAQQHSARSQQEIQAAGEKIISHVQQHLDASAERVQRLEQNLSASQDRVQKLADTALNQQHLEKIGLNLEAQAGRVQQIEASLAATHGKLEQLDRNAASRDHLDQLAQSLGSHMARTEKIEAALVSLQGSFDQRKNNAASHEEVAQLGHGIETQTARLDGLEKSIASHAGSLIADVNQRIADLHKLVAEDVQNLEGTVKQQAASMESLRTAMSQTDDLVERVVEALESLQSTILEHNEERSSALN
ncbi:MAG: protein kinase [Bryobacteraceae bacterium]